MRQLFVLVALPALWLGCSSSGELSCPEGSTGTPGACLVSCTLAEQCLLDEQCIQGACQPIGPTDPVQLTLVRAVPAILPAGGGLVELEVVAINADELNVGSDRPAVIEPFVSTTTLGRIPLGMITESLSVSVQARKGESFSRTVDVEVTVDTSIPAPEIKNFSSNPVSLNAPGAITVSADFENADSAVILRDNVEFYGDVTSPFSFSDDLVVTTTYVLQVTGAGQMVQSTLRVPVGDVPPLMVRYEFDAQVANIARPGDVAHIRWTQTEGPPVDGLLMRVRRSNAIIAERTLPAAVWFEGTGSAKLPATAGEYTLELQARVGGQDFAVGSIEGSVAPRLRLEIHSAEISASTRFIPPGREVIYSWEARTGLLLEPAVFLRFGQGAAVSLPAMGQQNFAVQGPTDLVLAVAAERRAYGYALDRALPLTQTVSPAGGGVIDLSAGGASGAMLAGESHSFVLPVNNGDSMFVQLSGDCANLELNAFDPGGNTFRAASTANGCPSFEGEVVSGTGNVALEISGMAIQVGAYSVIGWRRSPLSHLVFEDRYESIQIMQPPFRPLDSQFEPVVLSAESATADVVLPFEFPFYGGRHRSITVHRDGFVSFGFTPERVVAFDGLRDSGIALFGGGLALVGAGQVLTTSVNDRGQQFFVVAYRNLASTNGNGTVSGLIFLRDDGHVFTVVDAVDGDGNPTWFSGIRGSGQQAAHPHPACNDLGICSGDALRGSVAHFVPYDRPPENL